MPGAASGTGTNSPGVTPTPGRSSMRGIGVRDPSVHGAAPGASWRQSGSTAPAFAGASGRWLSAVTAATTEWASMARSIGLTSIRSQGAPPGAPTSTRTRWRRPGAAHQVKPLGASATTWAGPRRRRRGRGRRRVVVVAHGAPPAAGRVHGRGRLEVASVDWPRMGPTSRRHAPDHASQVSVGASRVPLRAVVTHGGRGRLPGAGEVV